MRAIALLASRATRDSARAAVLGFDSDAMTKDPVIADLVLESALVALADEHDAGRWPALLSTVKSAFRSDRGDILVGYDVFRSGGNTLPAGIASAILGAVDDYPLTLVHAADAVLSTPVVRIAGVGSIARRDGWASG